MSMTEIDTIVVMNNLISDQHTINKLWVVIDLPTMTMIMLIKTTTTTPAADGIGKGNHRTNELHG